MKPLSPRAPRSPPQRILLVEDEPALAEILEAFLKAHGRFEVVLARDEADALAKAHKSPPDVAVLDLEVRDLDGAGLLEKLRAGDALLPALACAGRDASEPAPGFDALFLKPLDLTSVLAQVERLLEDRGRRGRR
ncbi:MAG TPA: response regulator [Anaeromyxobacteraceae bacterium]|nr:response regulator [Anaeromyxobacteraceae bacterium]